MNLSFYAAISRVDMGIVVAVEFLGPLAVSVLGSRRPLDALWIVLAGMGVILLAGPTGSAAPLGVSFALLAAFFWAAYLLLAKRALSRMEPLQVTVLMLAGSSLLLTPIMVVSGIRVVGKTDVLLLGLAVAVLSSALPYLLDLFALRRVRASTYGVLLSIAPAMAALVGFVVLSQHLTPAELGGIGAVVLAAGGASWMSGSGRSRCEEARVELATPSD
jgi:inner membrane transporter RhtA